MRNEPIRTGGPSPNLLKRRRAFPSAGGGRSEERRGARAAGAASKPPSPPATTRPMRSMRRTNGRPLWADLSLPERLAKRQPAAKPVQTNPPRAARRGLLSRISTVSNLDCLVSRPSRPAPNESGASSRGSGAKHSAAGSGNETKPSSPLGPSASRAESARPSRRRTKRTQNPGSFTFSPEVRKPTDPLEGVGLAASASTDAVRLRSLPGTRRVGEVAGLAEPAARSGPPVPPGNARCGLGGRRSVPAAIAAASPSGSSNPFRRDRGSPSRICRRAESGSLPSWGGSALACWALAEQLQPEGELSPRPRHSSSISASVRSIEKTGSQPVAARSFDASASRRG